MIVLGIGIWFLVIGTDVVLLLGEVFGCIVLEVEVGFGIEIEVVL